MIKTLWTCALCSWKRWTLIPGSSTGMQWPESLSGIPHWSIASRGRWSAWLIAPNWSSTNQNAPPTQPSLLHRTSRLLALLITPHQWRDRDPVQQHRHQDHRQRDS